MLKTCYQLGVACDDGSMKHPHMMVSNIVADTYEEARDIFLQDASVAKRKANDIVMLLSIVDAPGDLPSGRYKRV